MGNDERRDGEERRSPGKGLTRRQFLIGVGAGAAATSLPLRRVVAAGKAAAAPALGPGPVPVDLTVNGKKRRVFVEPRVTLLDALRDDLAVTGPKRVCDRGSCGACTVLVDGKPMVSCMLLAVEAAGASIETVEGLTPEDGLSPLQEAFIRHDALQCGFCTSGMITSATALLRENKSPGEDEIRRAIAGNICRCGTYDRVVKAVADAAKGK